MAIYLFSVETCVFSSFVVPPSIRGRGWVFFFIIGAPLLHLIPPEVTLNYSVIKSSQVKVTLRLTVSQSVSLGIERHLGPMTRYLFLTVTFLFPWGALSDERTGLSFVCAVGHCQRSLPRVLVPWDLRPYFTVSDFRLFFSSPPTTRMVTAEVFDPASTRVYSVSQVKVTLRLTVSQSVSLGVEPHLGLMTIYLAVTI
jgi:hypothetical protein